jgi:hypothetical protein
VRCCDVTRSRSKARSTRWHRCVRVCVFVETNRSQAAAVHGVTINAASSLSLARSLDGVEANQRPFFNKLLRILSTRCMSQVCHVMMIACERVRAGDLLLFRH